MAGMVGMVGMVDDRNHEDHDQIAISSGVTSCSLDAVFVVQDYDLPNETVLDFMGKVRIAV